MIVPPDQYYVTRPNASDEYEGYFGVKTDPDGRQKNMLDESVRREYLERVEDEIEFVGSLGGGNLIDFACGQGWFPAEIRRRFVEWEVWGIEQPATEHLPKRLGIPMLSIREGIEDYRFDVVRAHHYIEHSKDPEHDLKNFHRILKPGGWLLISTPDFGGAGAAMWGNRYRMLHDETHCSLFTCESMHRFLRDFGFSIERLAFPFSNRYWEELQNPYVGHWSPPLPGNHMTFYARKL